METKQNGINEFCLVEILEKNNGDEKNEMWLECESGEWAGMRGLLVEFISFAQSIACLHLLRYFVFAAPEGYKIQLDFRNKFHIEPSDNCEFDHLVVSFGLFSSIHPSPLDSIREKHNTFANDPIVVDATTINKQQCKQIERHRFNWLSRFGLMVFPNICFADKKWKIRLFTGSG